MIVLFIKIFSIVQLRYFQIKKTVSCYFAENKKLCMCVSKVPATSTSSIHFVIRLLAWTSHCNFILWCILKVFLLALCFCWELLPICHWTLHYCFITNTLFWSLFINSMKRELFVTHFQALWTYLW